MRGMNRPGKFAAQIFRSVRRTVICAREKRISVSDGAFNARDEVKSPPSSGGHGVLAAARDASAILQPAVRRHVATVEEIVNVWSARMHYNGGAKEYIMPIGYMSAHCIMQLNALRFRIQAATIPIRMTGINDKAQL